MFGNIELRMSLRSISKYGSGIGKVIVAGCPPEWLSDEVVKIEVEDKFSYKHQNILHCIEKVVDMGLVHGDFLYSSDDHFYIQPVDFDNYPVYLKGELRNYVNKTDPYYQYHRSLYDTRLLCQKHNLPTMNYSQHCNTHMHAEVFKSIRDVIHEAYELPFGVEPTTIVMNAWQTMDDAPIAIHRDDVKILSARSQSHILKQIGRGDCFSIADSALKSNAMKKFLLTEYSIKSLFEK